MSYLLNPRVSRHALGLLLRGQKWHSHLAPEHVLMGSPVQMRGARAPDSDGVHTFLAAFSFSRRFENQPCSCVASSPMIALICRREGGRHRVITGRVRVGASGGAPPPAPRLPESPRSARRRPPRAAPLSRARIAPSSAPC